MKSRLNKYKSYFQNPIKKYLPIRHISTPSVGRDGNYFISKGTINYSATDWLQKLRCVRLPRTDKNRTKTFSTIRGKLRVRCPGSASKNQMEYRAKSSQTQDVFHKLVEDTLAQSDTTVTISNMRRSIRDTHVVLNLAISPGVILTPSRMIILDNPIKGFNNILV